MGDFTGFTFGGVSSSSLNILRVSEGDRYNETLHPDIQDINAEVPGMDGMYYFGSTYGVRTITVSIAFDSVTEADLKKIKKVYGTREIKELIFDERPYIKYLAKIASPIELSYVCFDEPNYTWEKIPLEYDGEHQEMGYVQGVSGDFEYKSYTNTKRRIYKGEGTIEFVCYFPFGKSAFKVLSSADEDSDWAISSGILSEAVRSTQHIDAYNDGVIKTYNPGDVATGFRLYVPFDQTTGDLILHYKSIYTNNEPNASLVLSRPEKIGNDVGFLINSDNGLIQGVSVAPHIDSQGNKSYSTSGNIYNKYISAGYLFKIEPNSASNEYGSITITNGTSGIEIFYDYLYF